MLNWMRKYTDPLCEVSGDKFMHLLTCQLIAFVVGRVCGLLLGRWYGSAIGFVVAVGAGFFKEIDDDTFDYDDFKVDVLGAAWGALYCLI